MQKIKVVISIIILLFAVSYQSPALALDKMSLQDRIVASTFKALARGFVAVLDLDKFKKDNISMINKMQPEKFKIKYAKIYETLKDLPPELKAKYGISENMSKEQLIKDIELSDKKSIYESINAVPDAFIAKEFKEYLNQKNQGAQKIDLVKEINEFWGQILAKIQQSSVKK
ncbi:MAG: hypothetical protein NT014_02570 [Candidatus Omnitrophica bacterium]|nr:hypothetical protein [Candidatus Omnitrophota bacterium]